MTNAKTLIIFSFITATTLFSLDVCCGDDSLAVKTEYNTAILKYEKELLDSPQNPKLHYNLATASYAIDNKQKAIEEFKKAKQLYIAQGDIEAALQVENALNTLSLPEALKEIEKQISDLKDEIKEIKKIINK